MITGELRNKIDRIWEIFWTGGITNPLDVIEQFTYLLFIKQLDDVETTKENEANFLGVEYETMFPGESQRYRWSKFKNLGSADEMYVLGSLMQVISCITDLSSYIQKMYPKRTIYIKRALDYIDNNFQSSYIMNCRLAHP